MKLHEWKTRIQSGEHLLGTMVTTFASADLPKILKACGFDFFIIDCEHGSFTTREVADMICVARAIDLPGMVRIPELRREHVLHCMELGAAGLLLPNTETAEQARQLVDYAKYAPMGHRGVSLSRPHTDFLKQDSAAYMQSANRDTVLLCQIESQLGVSNIDAIMAVDGIDGAMIGPNDMSQDFGILGQYAHPAMQAAFRQVIAAAARHGKVSGAHFGAASAIYKAVIALPVALQDAFIVKQSDLLLYKIAVFKHICICPVRSVYILGRAVCMVTGEALSAYKAGNIGAVELRNKSF